MTTDVVVGDVRDILMFYPDGWFDCVVTDPPYGQTSLPWDRPLPLGEWLPAIDRVLKPTGSMWVWGTLRSLSPLVVGAEALGWRMAQDVVWEKHNGSGFQRDRFRRVHEQAVQLYRGRWRDVYKAEVVTMDATARKVSRKRDGAQHTGKRGPSSYETEEGGPRLARSVIFARSCHRDALHPTQKPEEVIRPLIEHSCPEGGVVLDPFGGAGTTGLVASKLGRKAVCIELNPDYARMAHERIPGSRLCA